MDLKKDVKKGSVMGEGIGFSGADLTGTHLGGTGLGGTGLGMSGMGLGGLKDATSDKFSALKVFLGSLSVTTGVAFIFWLFTGILGGSLEALGFIPTAEPANVFGSIIVCFILFVFSLSALVLTKSIEDDYNRMKQLNAGNSRLHREACKRCKASKKSKMALDDAFSIDSASDEDDDDYVTDLEETVHNLREKEKDMRADISYLKRMVRELYAHCVSKTSVDSWFPISLTTDKDWVSSFNEFAASFRKQWDNKEDTVEKED